MSTSLQVDRLNIPVSSAPAPARILEIELAQPIPALSACDERGQSYRRALGVVRLHTQPLGFVEFQFDEHGVSAANCARQIWQCLREQINAHLQQDNLPPVTELDPAGLPVALPRCIQEREELLEQAPFVSVIVPTHNRPHTLLPCLLSLLTLRYPHYEIIVVDNAPTMPETAKFVQEIMRKAPAPQVRYLREDRPGPSWARNCGMLAARGDILAFTDDDVMVDSYWLVELVRGFGRTENVACVTGCNLPLELETPSQFWYEAYGGVNWFQEDGGPRWDLTPRIFDLKEHRAKTPLYPYKAGIFGGGSSMAFTAAFLRSVQGFDPALGGGGPSRSGEDIAVFFQVVTRGYTLVYAPTALIYHRHRRDYRELQRQIYNYGVGITAYLTKSLLDAPHLLPDFFAQTCVAYFQSFFKQQRQSRKLPPHYPRELIKIRRKGMLYGPIAYLQGRRLARKMASDRCEQRAVLAGKNGQGAA
ncbi:MAG TPA: glycosyltransferase [Ktedonobacterales bacterium]|jgi:glycosyltransferase involved in cell wall biosynthesis